MNYTVSVDAVFESEQDAKAWAKTINKTAPRARTQITKGVGRPLPELWGAAEVASYLGISHTNMYGKNKRTDVPPARMKLRRGQLWLADDVRAARAKRNRQKDPR